MSKLLENKQIIHIATEIVALMGIVFYFSSKNKKLLEHIEDLSQRLEDQEDLIQKHEQIIRQLVQTVNKGSHNQSSQPKYITKPTQEKNKKMPSPTKRKDNDVKSKIQLYTQEPVEQVVEQLVEQAVIEEYSSDSDSDSDLDADIAEELDELQEQDGLKKRI
jgi:cell division septum initiation protein DivIVA